MLHRSVFRVTLGLVGLILFTSCSLAEPVVGFTFREQRQSVPQDQVTPVCKALEAAGYGMPYGPMLPWRFELTRSEWVLNGAGNSAVTLAQTEPDLYLIVDRRIPADLDGDGDPVSEETVAQLAGDAKSVCRIVQREATRQGIGPVGVYIRLWDLIVGTEIDYSAAKTSGSPYTSHCDDLTGAYVATSISLHPSAPVPGHCPSLYVSADSMTQVRLDIGGDGWNARP